MTVTAGLPGIGLGEMTATSGFQALGSGPLRSVCSGLPVIGVGVTRSSYFIQAIGDAMWATTAVSITATDMVAPAMKAVIGKARITTTTAPLPT